VDFLVEEGKWEANKTKAGKVTRIIAPHFDFEGTRDQLIQLIETANEEKELRLMVRQLWAEIDKDCSVNRKRRYE
jgi:hypothetical protein